MEEDEVVLNVGGTLFVTYWGTLLKYPKTKLGSLTESSPYFKARRGYYFFDRNPELFNTILDFYRNDVLHFPNHLCSGLWYQELRYWGLSISSISDCCHSTYVQYCKNDKIIQNLRKALTIENSDIVDTDVTSDLKGSTELVPSGDNQSLRMRVWKFLSEPKSSFSATIYNWFYFLMVFLSAISAILYTLPQLRTGNIDFGTSHNQTGIIQRLRLNSENTKEIIFHTTEIPHWLRIFDLFIACFFVAELIIRIILCPDKKHFFKDWLNLLDIAIFNAILVRVVVDRNRQWLIQSYDIMILYKICNVVTVFRIFRFLRFARQFSGLYVLLLALRASFKELLLLFFTLLLFALLFANCIFYTEIEEPTTFPNMLYGIWWAIITLTTVGYGDHVPKSWGGQVIGTLCAICGVIVLAMPVAMIVANFNNYYQKKKDREQFIVLRDYDRKHVDTAI